MCGIAGYLASNGHVEPEILRAMSDALAHRGPDDDGIWVHPEGLVGLGHRRLAVLDPSPSGRQPMASRSGRFVITFNGEIYNFRELRGRLEQLGHTFATGTDTEVLLTGFDQWGIAETVVRADGMFAFGVVDLSRRRLVLGRDRFGEKPLYWGHLGGNVVFASELRALYATPWPKAIDRSAVASLLSWNSVQSPLSILEGVGKVPAATLLELRIDEPAAPPSLTRYWSLRATVELAKGDELPAGEEVVEHLDAVLRRSVASRTVSDVPVGAFLSGGIDSSTIVATLQATSPTPVKTFTIGFTEATYDESPWAKEVAKQLGTCHTELRLSAADAEAAVPDIAGIYDEPFADSSQLPTLLVSRLARRDVTVVLTGDGGDELFGGYNRYLFQRRLWKAHQVLGHSARHRLANGLERVLSNGATRNGLERAVTALPQRYRIPMPLEKAAKTAKALGVDSPEALYDVLTLHWPDSLVKGAATHPRTTSFEWPDISDAAERMMFRDMVTYMCDDILVKVDRAAMSVGLETRVPFLSPEIVDFAWRLPIATKIGRAGGKLPLRGVLDRYLEPRLVRRPKMGFGVPIGTWLRTSLRPWAEELLSPSQLAEDDLLDPNSIRELWSQHLAGATDGEHLLWDVLMLQAWRREWGIRA